VSAPYYEGGGVTLFCGDMREVLPTLGQFDACVTDPPYGETSLAWDQWPDGWPALVAGHTSSMWCFGSMRMFLAQRDEFAGWKLAQDTIGEFEIDTMVWEKGNGSGPSRDDRFRRVHELATHWYRGLWRDK
jgi:site-specific DNA-methyltransferase (adenine-specific)